MRSNIATAVFCAAALISTGCGACTEFAANQALKSAGVEVDTKGGALTLKGKDGEEVRFAGDDGGAFSFKGKDGEIKINADGSGKLPDGFPLEVAGGALVKGSAAMNNAEERTFIATLQHEGELEKFASFYVRELEAKGFSVERSDLDMSGRKVVMLGGSKEGREASVALSTGSGAAIDTQISFVEKK